MKLPCLPRVVDLHQAPRLNHPSFAQIITLTCPPLLELLERVDSGSLSDDGYVRYFIYTMKAIVIDKFIKVRRNQ